MHDCGAECIYVCMSVCMHACVSVVYVCMCQCMHVCTCYVLMYVCMHLCMCMRRCVCVCMMYVHNNVPLLQVGLHNHNTHMMPTHTHTYAHTPGHPQTSKKSAQHESYPNWTKSRMAQRSFEERPWPGSVAVNVGSFTVPEICSLILNTTMLYIVP